MNEEEEEERAGGACDHRERRRRGRPRKRSGSRFPLSRGAAPHALSPEATTHDRRYLASPPLTHLLPRGRAATTKLPPRRPLPLLAHSRPHTRRRLRRRRGRTANAAPPPPPATPADPSRDAPPHQQQGSLEESDRPGGLERSGEKKPSERRGRARSGRTRCVMWRGGKGNDGEGHRHTAHASELRETEGPTQRGRRALRANSQPRDTPNGARTERGAIDRQATLRQA